MSKKTPKKLNLRYSYSDILIMLVSAVVPKKLPGQKRHNDEEEEHDFLAFSASV